jgi:hypothetical protein
MAHVIPEDGTLLPLMEEFYTIQGEGFNPVRPHTLFAWVAAMWAAIGVM